MTLDGLSRREFLTGQELQTQLLARDAVVLNEVYERFGAAVFRAALAVTRDHAAAEDVTQTVMVALWNHPEKFRPDLGGLGPWLAQMAYFRSVDWVRRQAAERRRELRLAQYRSDRQPSTEEQVEAILQAEQTRLLLAALPDSERIPITLTYLAGLTFRQAAAALAVPQGTVKGRARSGCRRMATSGLGAR